MGIEPIFPDSYSRVLPLDYHVIGTFDHQFGGTTAPREGEGGKARNSVIFVNCRPVQANGCNVQPKPTGAHEANGCTA